MEIFKNFAASAAARLHLFLIGGGGSEIFKTFAVSAAAAVLFWKKSAAAAAAQPIGLHLYSNLVYIYSTCEQNLSSNAFWHLEMVPRTR